jgi:cytochrome P450
MQFRRAIYDSRGAVPPTASGEVGWRVLKGAVGERSLLRALELMHAELGDIFQIALPGFAPVVVAGPELNRCILVDDRANFLWRNENDPVTRLLRHGLLVEDGDRHDCLRSRLEPALRGAQLEDYAAAMIHHTDQVLRTWHTGERRDMLVEMRRVALLILMGTLFDVDFRSDLDRMWRPILRAIDYISPGLWIVWPRIPRPGYRQALAELDEYLYGLIRARRLAGATGDDLLSQLVNTPDLSDDLIRDQVLTMLIAGHDTSTALLAWALYLLARRPATMADVQAEVDAVVGHARPGVDHLRSLTRLDQAIRETLRLYPPIHVGNRLAATDVELDGYRIPAGTRVMHSIYLTQRDPAHWAAPTEFRPERFAPEQRGTRPPLSYLPFGAGPRNCIGATFAQIEAKLVLARILQRFDLSLEADRVHPHMGATLEPRPDVVMRIHRRAPRHG